MAGRSRDRQNRLTKERVVEAALTLADRAGVNSLSMRRLAAELGVEAMSLYHHVANKDAILDGIVDAVFSEIELPDPQRPWRDVMAARARSVRAALLRHSWAVGLMDSRRNAGPATLAHHDAVIGSLLAGGFSIAQTAHAFSLLDSYIYGFVLQELALPFSNEAELAEVSGDLMAAMPPDAFPNLMRLMVEHALQPGYSYEDEFAVGLELILEGLQRMVSTTV